MIMYLIQSRFIRSYAHLLNPFSSHRFRTFIARSTKTRHSSSQDYRLYSSTSSNSTSSSINSSEVSKKSSLSSSRLSPAYESNQGSAEYDEFIKYIRFKDFEGLKTLYHRNKAIGMLPLKQKTYNSILVVCQESAHLPLALEVFEDMVKMDVPPIESTFLPLIRCYCSVDDVLTSLNLVKQMRDIGIEPKLRTYQPILDTLCKVRILLIHYIHITS